LSIQASWLSLKSGVLDHPTTTFDVPFDQHVHVVVGGHPDRFGLADEGGIGQTMFRI
jgi:hypothetical protein